MASRPQVPAGYFLEWFDEIDSTNAEALRRAGQGPLWIVAANQHHGRGRRGRKWIAAPGNLFATLLLDWQGPTKVLSQLSFVTAVACVDVLAALVKKSGSRAEVALKWPNDILLNNTKVGGILIETSQSGSTAVAIGIGINVAGHPAETLAYPTTNLAEHGIKENSSQVFEHLAISFDRYFTLWQGGAGFAEIKQHWLKSGPPVGHELKVDTGAEVFSGVFAGLDSGGGLQIRMPDGSLKIILAGDIVEQNSSHKEKL